MIRLSLVLALTALFILSNYNMSFGQEEDLTTPGSVWEMTFVKVKPHAGEQYIQGLKKTWKSSMDEFVKAGLIKSYKILWGDVANQEDFNMLLMIEHENFAAFDPNPEREKKFEEIEKRIQDGLGDEYKKIVEGYASLRELLGNKVMREITIN